MIFSKILNTGRQLCRNLTLKEYSVTPETAPDVLAEYWPDVHTSCYAERSAQWINADVDLSIILPSYQDAAHICRSVDSVLEQQTEYSFEVVVINDGSTDHTAQLLQNYEALPNVTVIHQENKGHSGARNAGLSLCRGRYILFHDSDDTLLPGAIQNLLSCGFRYDADVVAGGYLEEAPDGSRYPGMRYSEGAASPAVISGMTCGKVFKRKLFEHLQFPMGYWYEDSIISQIILPAAKICRCIEPEVFAYFQNESGVSASSVGHKKSLDSLYITRALLEDKPKFGLPLDAEAYAHFLYMILLTYHRTAQLDGRPVCAVFHYQRYLKQRFFPDITDGSPMEQALVSGSFHRYLWLCETQWIIARLKERLLHD